MHYVALLLCCCAFCCLCSCHSVAIAGDIAYDLDTQYDEGTSKGDTGLDGGKGDQFMRDLEPIASAVPYMVCPGYVTLSPPIAR